MEDSTLPDPYVQKFLNNFEFGKINAEVDTIISGRYGVRSYPTTLILKPNGVEIDRMVGYYPPEEFVTGIVNSLSGIGTLDDLQNKLAVEPDNIDLLYEIGQKHRWRGDYGKAASFFRQILLMDADDGQGYAEKAAYNLAHMKYKEKNFLQAVDLFRKMAVDYPKSELAMDAELMVGYCYQQATDFKNAKKAYNEFLKRHPDTEEKEWIGKQFEKMKK